MTPWILSYIGSNAALIVVVVLVVIALGAVAWFAKNWKVAVAAIVVLAVALAYQQIDKNAYERAVAAQAAAQVKVLQGRLAALNKINADNAEQALADAAEIQRLQQQTPPNSSPCLDVDAAKRIGAIR